jgi:hypothetical protein
MTYIWLCCCCCEHCCLVAAAAAVAEQVASHETPELDMDVCLQLMSWNKEAIQRALKLSAPNKAARNCRALFHHLLPGPTGGPAASPAAAGQAGAGGSAGGAQAGGAPAPHPVAHPGCLLEQLARYEGLPCAHS